MCILKIFVKIFFHKYNMNFEDYINEALKVKYVVRKNKKTKKYKTDRPGKYRVEYDANR